MKKKETFLNDMAKFKVTNNLRWGQRLNAAITSGGCECEEYLFINNQRKIYFQ